MALVISPAICATLLKTKPGDVSTETVIPDNLVYRSYTSSLNWSLKHRWFVVILANVALVFTFYAFGNAELGVELFSLGTPDDLRSRLNCRTVLDSTTLKNWCDNLKSH